MKQTTGKQKTVQPKAQVVEETAAGAQGVALAPPVSEVAMADSQPVQRVANGQPENRTGLPDKLKAGVEVLSGMSLDDVRVHYNSRQPAHLNALAYTKGSDIHVAPGQECHLPHEAWHVVQQAQGRVQPTMEVKDGVSINNDERLEHEAHVMGATALKSGTSNGLEYTQHAFGHGYQDNMDGKGTIHSQSTCYPVQRVEDPAAPAPTYEILNPENYSQDSIRILADLVAPLVSVFTAEKLGVQNMQEKVQQTEYTIILDLNERGVKGVRIICRAELWSESWFIMRAYFGNVIEKLRADPKVQKTEYNILLKLGRAGLD